MSYFVYLKLLKETKQTAQIWIFFKYSQTGQPILQIIVGHCHPNVRKSERKLEHILSKYFLA